MKSLGQLAVLLFIVGGFLRAEDGKHLFILSGQSNMAGMKPELSFTPAVQKAFGADNVIVVKHASSGKPIRDWYKGWNSLSENSKKKSKCGGIYDSLMEKVKKAVGTNEIKTVTYIWMQGERDAFEGHGDKYEASYKGIMAQLETDLGRKDVNHVIGRLSDFGINDKDRPDWNKIRQIEMKLAEENPNVEWIDTDDLNGDDNGLHMTNTGYVTMGERFAEKAIELINKQLNK